MDDNGDERCSFNVVVVVVVVVVVAPDGSVFISISVVVAFLSPFLSFGPTLSFRIGEVYTLI